MKQVLSFIGPFLTSQNQTTEEVSIAIPNKMECAHKPCQYEAAVYEHSIWTFLEIFFFFFFLWKVLDKRQRKFLERKAGFM